MFFFLQNSLSILKRVCNYINHNDLITSATGIYCKIHIPDMSDHTHHRQRYTLEGVDLGVDSLYNNRPPNVLLLSIIIDPFLLVQHVFITYVLYKLCFLAFRIFIEKNESHPPSDEFTSREGVSLNVGVLEVA